MIKIVDAAIKYSDGEVATGKRHYQIIFLKSIEGRSSIGAEQGFVDSKGNFLTREEAKEVALRAGQIKKSHKGLLFSEDVWPELGIIEL